MKKTTAPDDFVQLLVNSQSRLYAFIMSLVGDPEQAAEIQQEANLVLWRKSDEFELGTNFVAWAFKIARYQTMAYRQKTRRDRHLFDDDVLGQIADEFERSNEDFDERLAALSHCLERLPEPHRRMIHQRYGLGLSVRQLSDELGHTANRLAVRLYRIRAALSECIRGRVIEEPSS